MDSLLDETAYRDGEGKGALTDLDSKSVLNSGDDDGTASLCSCGKGSQKSGQKDSGLLASKKAINVSAVTIAIEEAIKSVEEGERTTTQPNHKFPSKCHEVARSKSFDARLFQKLDWTAGIMKRLKKQSFYGSSGHFLGGYPPPPPPTSKSSKTSSR